MPRNCATSLFELVIRDVGGLLAAYDLSGDRMFVTRWGTLDMACSPPPAGSSFLCLRPERKLFIMTMDTSAPVMCWARVGQSRVL